MTREQALSLLRKTPCKYAEVIVDVWSVGDTEPCYPKEKIIVSVLETQDFTKFIGKAYTTFNSLRDFRVNSVFGEQEARKTYCRYYFGNISAIYYKY